MKMTLIFLWLTCFLVACVSATPTPPPTTPAPAGSTAVQTQTQPEVNTPSTGPTLAPTQASTLEITATQLASSDLSLQRAAQVGGSIKGIAVVGDVAYVGMGPRLAAIDISRHESPTLISQSEVLPGSVTQVLPITSKPAPLLLVNAGKYLVLMDPSTPGKLKPVEQVELPGAVSVLAWDAQAGMVYAGGSIYQKPEKYTGFVAAVKIIPEDRLELIDSVPLPERPLSLAPGNGILFAGAGGYEGGLYFIQLNSTGELSTPHLSIASTPESPLHPTHLKVIGERLYLSYRGFEAYDITDPAQPVLVWSKGLPGGPVIGSFSMAGGQVYAFGWTILSEIKHGTITVPEPIVGDPTGITASVTAIHNGGFLVAFNDLKIYATADLQALPLVGSFQVPVSDAIDAVANESAVFVIDNGAGDGLSQADLKVLSLPDLKLLGQVKLELPNDSHDLHGLALEGDRVYIAIKDSVWAYDVSSAQPALLWKQKISDEEIGKIAAFQLAEKRLLVVSQETKESSLLATYDLTDLQKIGEIGRISSLESGDILQLGWDGFALNALLRPLYETKFARLYRLEFEGGILVMKESLEVPGYPLSMAANQKIYALAGSGSLSIVTADQTGKRNVLRRVGLPEYGLGAAMLEDWALVAAGDDDGAAQLLTFDLRDPARPRQAGAVDIPVSGLYQVPVLVSGPYVVMANGTGGVEVLEYSH